MVQTIVGLMGSSVAAGSAKLASPEQLRGLVSMLASHGVGALDTARVYNAGRSEELVGALPAALTAPFAVHTKAPGFSPGSLAAQHVLAACAASLAALQRDAIDLYYFHGPDRQTPLETSCAAINQLHQEGKIKAFGLSNFSWQEVESVHAICTANDWLRPTVYQGGYNPLARTAETALLPTLRKLGIAFYAYSPLAGGFFSRSTHSLRQEPEKGSRMDQMKHFRDMYVDDLTLDIHETLSSLCQKEGLTLQQATLRYLAFHSALGPDDAVILGGSSTEQMEENLRAMKGGPLPQSVVHAFENMWERRIAKGEKPPYCV